MIHEQTCQIDLNKPGKFLTLDVADYGSAVASVYIISTAGSSFASGTLVIQASADGYEWSTELWEFTTEGAARLDVRGHRFIRAGVGTKASSAVQVHVTLTASPIY